MLSAGARGGVAGSMLQRGGEVEGALPADNPEGNEKGVARVR